jgi:SAM-dependent methyltransferase
MMADEMALAEYTVSDRQYSQQHEIKSLMRIALLVHPNIVNILHKLVVMLTEGLNEIGIESEIVHESRSILATRVIVLGANFFPTSEFDSLPRNTIIFNVENSSSQFMTNEYTRVLRRFTVWDYDQSNAADLAKRLVRPVHYFRMLYVGQLKRIMESSQKDIDVLFFGSFNARRSAILDALRGRGLVVKAVFGVFGAELDALIARSRLVINIHFYENGRLEMIRLFDLLANGQVVVTELNPGDAIDEDLAGVLITAPYDQLVETTETLLRDSDRCCNVAKAGFEAFSRRAPNVILREALAWSDTLRCPNDAVIGSGKMYNPNFLNIDIDERWHPDIVADIADPDLFTREFTSARFGMIRLQRGWFDSIVASHVLEHIPDLVQAMTNCLELLHDGGLLRITVPYDLSYGAWQDPTHVHAFNERSWLYYCEWHWYIGWTECRFDLVDQRFRYSPLGDTLAARGCPSEEILRSPRAVDEMQVVLQKRRLSDEERAFGEAMRGDARANGSAVTG